MKVSVYNFNGVFDTLVNYLSMGGVLVPKWQDAEVVVLWQDVMGGQKTVAEHAKFQGKKVIVAEHGLLSINDYITPLSRPLVAEKLMVWGETTKKWLLERSDIPEEKIVVTGTTVFDGFRPKRLHKGKTVLFAPRHWSPDIPENLKMAKELKKLKVNVISKIVEGEHDPKIYPNPIATNRGKMGHLMKTWEALAEADVLVTLGEGTIAALAYYMNIPVITLDEWEDKVLLGKKYTKEIFFEQVSDACERVPLNKLNKAVMEAIENPDKNLAKRLTFLRDYTDYDSDKPALQKMVEVIYG